MGYVRHFNIGGTSADIPEYDDSAIRADISALKEKDKALDAKDNELDAKIDKEIQDRKDADDAIRTEIAGLDGTDYIQNVPYPYHNVYLDYENGDDTNDGTSDHPWKTFDKAMNEANKWGDFRIYIKTAGNYYWNNPTLNGVTLHIKPLTTGVKIYMATNSSINKIAVSIYNCHINWGSDDYTMAIYTGLMYDNYKNKRPIYFENCATTLNNLNIYSWYKLDTFGGSLYMHDCTLYGNLDLRQTNAELIDNVYRPVLSINGEISSGVKFEANIAIWNGSNAMINGCTFDMTNVNPTTTDGARLFSVRGSIMTLLSKVTLANGSQKALYAYNLSSAYVIVTPLRWQSILDCAQYERTKDPDTDGVNSVYYNNGIVSCLQPPAYKGMARIKDNCLEMCTGTSEWNQEGTWKNVNRDVRFLDGTIKYFDGSDGGGDDTWKIGKGQTRTSNNLVQCYVNDTIGWQTIYDVDNPPDSSGTTYVGKARYDGDVPQVYKSTGWTSPNRAMRYIDGTAKYFDGGDSGSNTWKEAKGMTRLTGTLFQVYDGSAWKTVKDFSAE